MNRSRKSPDRKNRADQQSLPSVGKSPSRFKLGLMALGLAALGSFSAQAADKTFNLDTDPNGVLDFFGTSVWTPTGGNPATGGFLEVTSALGSQKGTIIFDDFDAGLIVKSFTFSMDLKIGDGTTSPADGFSINYCSADDPLIVAHDGNGWAASPGNEANLPEEGTQTGLGVGFDAWNSGSGDIIGISVRVDNVLLTQIPMPTLNGAATDATSLQTGPRANGDGLGAGLTWQPLKLQLDENAILNIWWKNIQIVTNLQTTFFPRPGRIVFGGRTGGSYQLQSVDNIHIVTVAAGSPLIGRLTGTPDGFNLLVNNSPGNALVANSLTAKLDGNNVTFKSVVTQGASNVFIMSSFPTLLPSGSAHSLDVTYLDAQGNTSVYTNRTFNVPAYTTMAATETAPADKVDKTAAGFVANVVQANSVAALANTAERAEKQLRGELMNGSTPYANVANAGPFNIDGIINLNRDAVGLGAEIGDFQSPDYPDAPIPGVDGLWQTDPALTQGFDNVAAEITGVLDLTKGVYTFGVNSDDGFRVTFGASQFDVLNTTYGLYEGGKGASDVLFTVVAFDDGLYPFRLVWYNGNGGANVEFFSVAADGTKIPVNDIVAGAIKSYKAVAANKPARVQVASPMPGGLGISPLAPVEVELIDGSTTVNKDSVTLNVLGAAVTPTVTKNGTLTKVVYTHDVLLFPQGSNITAILVYLDSASKSITNTWTFTTMSGAVVIPASYALPATSGQTPGFSTRMVQTSVGATTTIAWNEDLLAGNGAQGGAIIYRAYDEPVVINYWGSGGVGNFANDAVNLPGGSGADLANYAMEMIAYVQLDKGVYTFGVNSDDGFDLTFGAEPHAKSVSVASFNAGRGTGDTDGTFIISTNGLYPLRLMFFQGGGGDACELYYKDSAGVRSLINDSTAAKYIKAYRYSTALSTAVTLTQQLSNTTITAYTPLRLTVAATSGTITNPALFAFQWMKSGGDIVGENGPTYYRQYAAPEEAGTYSCKVILLGYPAVTSASATVTVTSDSAPPTVVGAKGGASLKTVTISFNKAVDYSTAADLANYSIPGLTLDNTVAPATLNFTNVVLATALQTQGKSYTVTVTGVKSMSGVVIAGSNTATFSGFVEVAGFATLEFFDNITGTTVANLTGNAKFLGNQADRIMANTSFQTLSWENGDNYGGRATAILTAPASGNYTFYTSSDDNSVLFISPDENPVDVLSATPIAMVSSVTTGGYSNQREWGKNAEQMSAPQTLVAGKKYYVTALWKEGGGGDGVAIGWTKPGEAATVINAIPGSVLSGFIDPDASAVTITTQPKALTVTQSRPATFTVAATGTSDVGTTVNYQWQRNGVDIAGATGAAYTIPLAALADNGAKFKVVASVPAKSVTSDEVMLTVNADTVTPTIVFANAWASGQKVGILFDEMLDKTSAELGANYSVTGATVTNAVLRPNGMLVVLSLDIAATAGATVTVNGVKDVAGNPIAANAQIAIAFGGRVALFVVTGGATPTLNASDALLQNRLELRGYEVQVIGADVDNASMATGKNIVVISSTISSGAVAGTYKNVTVPVIDWEQGIQDDMAWTTVTGTTDRGSTTGLTTIEIVDATHPMAAGLPAGVVTIATAASEFAWGQPDANAKVVARLVGTTANACIYGYDKGALLTDGTAAAERRVLFLMTDNVAVNLNATGWKLFDAAIDWAQTLGGAQPAAPLITSAKDATGKVVITFEGTLQSAPAVVGPWTDVVGVSPLTVTPAGMQFYRAKK